MTLLSHYTSRVGLFGIVRSQSFWASEFVSLNDSSEFQYAFLAIYERALGAAIERIPTELRDKTVTFESLKSQFPILSQQINQEIAGGDGFGSLYVTSFARGKNKNEDERGILTLWDRYTRCEGYCLQFDQDNVERIVAHELDRHTYEWIELATVKYVIDPMEPDFCELVEQMSLKLGRILYESCGDSRVLSGLGRIIPDSSFGRKLLSYCGTHKDPAFSDEREVRILASPAGKAESRFLTGVATRKGIQNRSSLGEPTRYIEIGNNLLPGFVPSRILIGPKAQMTINDVWNLYPGMPEVRRSDIPIR